MRVIRIFCTILLILVLAAVPSAAMRSGGFAFQKDPLNQYAFYGYMDYEGNVVLPAVFSQIMELSYESDQNKRISVFKVVATESALINRQAIYTDFGEALTDFVYDQITRLKDGVYIGTSFEAEGNADILDAWGNILMQMNPDSVLLPTETGYLYLDNTPELYRAILLDEKFQETGVMMELSAPGRYNVFYHGVDTYISAPETVALSMKDTELFGLYNMRLEPVIEPNYYDIYQVTEDLFAVSNEMGLYALIDIENVLRTEYEYQYLRSYYKSGGFIEGHILNGSILLDKYGLALTEPGEFQYLDIYTDEGIAIAYPKDLKDGSPVIINPDGARIENLTRESSDFYFLGEDRAVYLTRDERGQPSLILYHPSTRESVTLEGIDKNFSSYYAYNAGDGAFTVVYQFEKSADSFRVEGLSRVYAADGTPITEPLTGMRTSFYNDGLIIAEKGRGNLLLYGVLDHQGNEILPFRYSKLHSVAPDVFLVREGSKTGYIDTSGNWIHQQSVYTGLMD